MMTIRLVAGKLTTGSGLFSRMASILSMTSGVNLGKTSSALRLSRTCSGFVAPKMTVDVLGFFATQARARCATLQLSSRYRECDQNKDASKTSAEQTLLCQSSKLLDLLNLSATILGVERIQGLLEKVGVGGKAGALRDTVVVLRTGHLNKDESWVNARWC
jgi:hypothetical protein